MQKSLNRKLNYKSFYGDDLLKGTSGGFNQHNSLMHHNAIINSSIIINILINGTNDKPASELNLIPLQFFVDQALAEPNSNWIVDPSDPRFLIKSDDTFDSSELSSQESKEINHHYEDIDTGLLKVTDRYDRPFYKSPLIIEQRAQPADN